MTTVGITEPVSGYPTKIGKTADISEILRMVNHEVGNTLSNIISNARIIEMEVAGLPEELSGRVKAIVDGAKRISMITHKLHGIDRLAAESYPSGRNPAVMSMNKSAGEHK